MLAVDEWQPRAPQHLDTGSAPAFDALVAACSSIAQDGKASPEAVERVKKALLSDPGLHGSPVFAAEARCLIETNDAVAFARNCSDWRALYARVIGNYLAARLQIAGRDLGRANWLSADHALSPAAPPSTDASSTAWLIRQVARTQNISPAEQALLVLLDQHVPGLTKRLVAAAA